MKMSRTLLGLIGVLAWAASPASAWWWNDGSNTYRSYSTTTFTVRPYNAFSDMSCSMSCNGSLPLSLLGACCGGGGGGGGCGNFGGGCCQPRCAPTCCAPACYPPPYWGPPSYPPQYYGGWPAPYYGGQCQTCAYPPAMYYPNAAYYPPLPSLPQPKRR